MYVSPPVPYAVRVLALSHESAWRTAAWTAAGTAVAADLALGPSEWAALAVLALLCASTVRMTASTLVETWLEARPHVRGALEAPSPTLSEFDGATRSALRSIAGARSAPRP